MDKQTSEQTERRDIHFYNEDLSGAADLICEQACIRELEIHFLKGWDRMDNDGLTIRTGGKNKFDIVMRGYHKTAIRISAGDLRRLVGEKVAECIGVYELTV